MTADVCWSGPVCSRELQIPTHSDVRELSTQPASYAGVSERVRPEGNTRGPGPVQDHDSGATRKLIRAVAYRLGGMRRTCLRVYESLALLISAA